jgi:hypothetical protein
MKIYPISTTRVKTPNDKEEEGRVRRLEGSSTYELNT